MCPKVARSPPTLGLPPTSPAHPWGNFGWRSAETCLIVAQVFITQGPVGTSRLKKTFSGKGNLHQKTNYGKSRVAWFGSCGCDRGTPPPHAGKPTAGPGRRKPHHSWGSRSFGTKNNDPLELFVFVSFCERLSYLSLRPIHCAEAVSSF